MRGLLFLFTVFIIQSVQAWDASRLKSHCSKGLASEPIVYADDFYFGEVATFNDLETRFNELYEKGDRLVDRFYFDESTQKVMVPVYKGEAEVSEQFVGSLVAHIEYALKRRLADYIFFPDMGHTHYYIPQEKWDREYAPIDNTEKATLYTMMMKDPDLKILYHTAEKLTSIDKDKQVLEDRDIQWRYYTRNVIGGNQGEGFLEILRKSDLNDGYNTVRDYEGHFYYSGGVYIHSTKNGCFSYEHRGERFYFDISYTYFPPRESYSDIP